MALKTTKIIQGLHTIAENYEGFLIDVYGVIHDGSQLYPGAIGCLEKLSKSKKIVALISNSPNRSKELSMRLNSMGIPSGYFQYVFTAGESTFQHLLNRENPWYSKLGNNCYFIGPAHSTRIYL